jgi:predicted GIY-YIG superfamily endonuclease
MSKVIELNYEALAFDEPIFIAEISKIQITEKLVKVKGRYFVYLLLNNEEVVYVGRSYNLCDRLKAHKYKKDFNSVYLAEYNSYYECCKAEKQITKYYSPRENKLWVKYGV